MTIIFNPDNRISGIGNAFTISISDGLRKILIYSGTQPTVSNFETDWSSNYYYDYSTGNYGSQLLCMYGNKSVDSSDLALSYNATLGTVYNSDTSYTKDYFQDGTASWAVMMREGSRFSSIRQNTISLEYVIVPVTISSGDGIIKLPTLSITSSVPDLYGVNINIT